MPLPPVPVVPLRPSHLVGCRVDPPPSLATPLCLCLVLWHFLIPPPLIALSWPSCLFVCFFALINCPLLLCHRASTQCLGILSLHQLSLQHCGPLVQWVVALGCALTSSPYHWPSAWCLASHQTAMLCHIHRLPGLLTPLVMIEGATMSPQEHIKRQAKKMLKILYIKMGGTIYLKS
jgi:hypothetical protein